MIPAYLAPLANHLWQSTIFALVVGLLALALRKNRAAVRYKLWLAASIKFLVPFSLLVSAGSQALGATLDEFSKTLRLLLDRPVIDKTGITGRFDIRVKFSREGTELASLPRTVAGAGTDPFKGPVPASDPAGSPSIFTALQEQLGLRLESGRGPVDMWVIDHIERPKENEATHVSEAPSVENAASASPISKTASASKVASSAGILSLISATPAQAQPQVASPPLAFEVASIKPSPAEADNHSIGCASAYSMSIPKGRCIGHSVGVRVMMLYAYGYRNVFQPENYLSGGPGWLSEIAYDLEAKAENDSATEDELREMLRNLLADRFKLKVHEITTDVPGYALVVAKSGPKLKEAAPDERAGGISNRTGMGGTHELMEQLAERLTSVLNRPIVDETNLTGFYDFNITWGTPESVAAEAAASGALYPEEAMKAALESQLGLRLEPQKLPKKELVIDHVEKPTPN